MSTSVAGVANPQMHDGERQFECSVDAVRGDAWDEVVARFDDGVIDQTWAQGEACWGADRLSTLILRCDGRIVAACLLVLFQSPLLPGGIAHAKFGPMWRRDGARERLYLREILLCLQREYVVGRGMYLRIMPPASPVADNAAAEELAAGGFAQHPVEDAERFIVDVSVSEEQLRSGLKSKWRYHLKKSAQDSLTVEYSQDESAVAEFLDLYAAMRSRKAFADTRALQSLPEIMARLPAALKATVWHCRHGDSPVAGAVVSRIGDTALYLFGASDERGRDLRAGYALHWAIVDRMRRDGCRWYDLGGACGNAGLRQFKTGLVGKHGVSADLPGHFDLAPGALSSIAARSVFRLKDFLGAAQERLSKTIKRTS